MKRPLDSHDKPRRDSAAQLVQLPNDRVLARHAAGITLLHGLTVVDLRRVLDLADGTRTVAGICEALAGEYDSEAVRRLIASLAGDLLRLDPPAEVAPAPRVFLAADGETSERLGLDCTSDPAN